MHYEQVYCRGRILFPTRRLEQHEPAERNGVPKHLQRRDRVPEYEDRARDEEDVLEHPGEGEHEPAADADGEDAGVGEDEWAEGGEVPEGLEACA